jgi:DNA repair exonuclease SbcCD ATPase subunit
MEDDINKVLKRFGDPFWVEASDDLSFIVHFPGEPPRSAARLSGGQKGILALGFRTTVSSIFGAEIGMMALDEPTAGMDASNREAMGEVLVRFAAEVRGRRQIIMITHADELRSSFDHVVDLGLEE